MKNIQILLDVDIGKPYTEINDPIELVQLIIDRLILNEMGNCDAYVLQKDKDGKFFKISKAI